MSVVMLRRLKLGNTSCKEITAKSEQISGVIRNDQPWPQGITKVIRWGTTSQIPAGVKVINKAEAISHVGHKAHFRGLLMDDWANRGGLGLPLCPYTYLQGDAPLEDILDHLKKVVVRPSVHAQGKHVYLVSDLNSFKSAVDECGAGWYASEFIDKVAEYRVTFVQDRVCWVAKKTPGNPEAVAWNVAKGGRFDNVRWGEWPIKAIEISLEAFKLSDLDFGAVDVMIDKGGKCYVLEINSAPSQTSPYRQLCMAKCFDYLIENEGKNLPIIDDDEESWKTYIHPALKNKVPNL